MATQIIHKKSFIENPRSSCALGGALITIGMMPDVIPIVHASLGCAGNLSGAISMGGGSLGSGYCGGASIPTSGITETEIVFGGADRLREQISSTLELLDAKLFVVATGCMTEMIGDDVQGVVNEFDGEPVIAVSTPSFKGDSYTGYEIVLDGIFNRYLPKIPLKDEKLVNLFGLVPAYDPFFRGDLEELARLIERLGLRANTFFTPDQTFENILSAPAASLNIVFSHVWGVPFVERFESKHRTPYWTTDLPIGAEASDRFLIELGKLMGVSEALVQSVIESENNYYYRYFERAADMFSNAGYKFYAETVTNSNYAIPITSYIERELGWVAREAFVTDQALPAQQRLLRDAFNASGLSSELIFETDTTQIAKEITNRHPQSHGERFFAAEKPVFILGSALERETAVKRGAFHLTISYPAAGRLILNRGYAGYKGGLNLFEDILGGERVPNV